MNQEAKLSVRCRPRNLNHHLWNNNGTFWCRLTVHLTDFTEQRPHFYTRLPGGGDPGTGAKLAPMAGRAKCGRLSVGGGARIPGRVGMAERAAGGEVGGALEFIERAHPGDNSRFVCTAGVETLGALQQRLLALGRKVQLYVG